MSADPGKVGANLLAYSYVGNNALARIDPTGMSFVSCEFPDSIACVGNDPPGKGDPGGSNDPFDPCILCLLPRCILCVGFGETPSQEIAPPPTKFTVTVTANPAKTGTQPCVAPNLLQRAGIAVQALVARISGTAVGFGVGGSFAAGNRVGVSLSVSRQLVVLPSGQAAFTTSVTQSTGAVFNSAVTPGIGAYGGLQLSFSNATSVGDLGGSSASYGYGGGAGVSAPAGVGHGFSIVGTSATPICGG